MEGTADTSHQRPKPDALSDFLNSVFSANPSGSAAASGRRPDHPSKEFHDAWFGPMHKAMKQLPDQIDEMLSTAVILDAFGIPAPGNYQTAKEVAGLLSLMVVSDLAGGSGTPPFLKFWEKLDAERAVRGEAPLGYGEAKKAYASGDTPLGALTFVGKEYDGLRAIPIKPLKMHELGRAQGGYYGEYRTVSPDDGSTVWKRVLNRHEAPVVYGCPEPAILNAKFSREEATAKTKEGVDTAAVPSVHNKAEH